MTTTGKEGEYLFAAMRAGYKMEPIEELIENARTKRREEMEGALEEAKRRGIMPDGDLSAMLREAFSVGYNAGRADEAREIADSDPGFIEEDLY